MPLPQDVAGALSSLVVGLINYQSPPTGAQPARYYSTIFRDLPNRTLYPDYYVVIKEPRSLNGVLVSRLALPSPRKRHLRVDTEVQ